MLMYFARASRGAKVLVTTGTPNPAMAVRGLLELVSAMAEDALDYGASKPQARQDWYESIVGVCESAERDLEEIATSGWTLSWANEDKWEASVPAFGHQRKPTVLSVTRERIPTPQT